MKELMTNTKKCVFCEIVVGNLPAKVEWSSEEFMAIQNKYPKAPVHLLVMPKVHLEKNSLYENGEFWAKMMKAVFEVIKIKGLDKTGYKLVNNGAGYNHFEHEHIHVLGGSRTEPGGET
jgi:histidine triad (HIT) family protein